MSTQIPLSSDNLEELKSFDQQHVIHGFYHPSVQKNPVIIDRAANTNYEDLKGEEYIDAMGGITVNAIGHSRNEMAEVALKQMEKMEFLPMSKQLTHPVGIHLADKLLGLARRAFPEMDAVYFTSGGSEANETAYHLALRYFANKGILGQANKFKVISFKNCYHGSTFFSFSAKPETTGYGWQRIAPCSNALASVHWFNHIDFPHELFFKGDMRSGESVGQAAARVLEETILKEDPNTVAVFIGEPIQGNGGIVIPHPDFWPLARKVCDKHNVLMIVDEVMTFAKTGKWFAMEHWNTAPDLITVSKSVTSGYLPLGAVLMNKQVHETALLNLTTKLIPSNFFEQSFTYSGHPVCAAVALKNLEIMERENLIALSEQKGSVFLNIFKSRLSGLRLIRDIRGKGIMIGIDFTTRIANEVEAKLLEQHKIIVLAGMNYHTLTLTPSPHMPEEQVHKIANALYDILTSFSTHLESAISSYAE